MAVAASLEKMGSASSKGELRFPRAESAAKRFRHSKEVSRMRRKAATTYATALVLSLTGGAMAAGEKQGEQQQQSEQQQGEQQQQGAQQEQGAEKQEGAQGQESAQKEEGA